MRSLPKHKQKLKRLLLTHITLTKNNTLNQRKESQKKITKLQQIMKLMTMQKIRQNLNKFTRLRNQKKIKKKMTKLSIIQILLKLIQPKIKQLKEVAEVEAIREEMLQGVVKLMAIEESENVAQDEEIVGENKWSGNQDKRVEKMKKQKKKKSLSTLKISKMNTMKSPINIIKLKIKLYHTKFMLLKKLWLRKRFFKKLIQLIKHQSSQSMRKKQSNQQHNPSNPNLYSNYLVVYLSSNSLLLTQG